MVDYISSSLIFSGFTYDFFFVFYIVIAIYDFIYCDISRDVKKSCVTCSRGAPVPFGDIY